MIIRCMQDLKTALKNMAFTGELDDSPEAIESASHDASMFELRPQLVARPKDSADVQRLVRFVKKYKKDNPDLSLTGRAAGTDMAGGAINDSIIVDFTKYFTKIGPITGTTGTTEPGVFYRDFEKETLKKNLLMPSYPASRDLAAMGGIVANNSGGEKSLEYGKLENFVVALKVVFADGKEYNVRPITKKELDAKIRTGDFEGKLYERIYRYAKITTT